MIVPGKVSGVNLPCRHSEQTDAAILEYKEKLKLEADLRVLKRNNRRFKNR